MLTLKGPEHHAAEIGCSREGLIGARSSVESFWLLVERIPFLPFSTSAADSIPLTPLVDLSVAGRKFLSLKKGWIWPAFTIVDK
jgi:hypothetical protein